MKKSMMASLACFLLLGFSLLKWGGVQRAHADIMITGAGSSFVAPVMYKWSSDYLDQKKVKVNYQSIGSGAGIKQVEGKTVDFGASDIPLSPKELEEKGLIQFPVVVSGIVVVVNIPGISAGKLILDGQTIAKIYSGHVTHWDDASVKALNPDLKLPHLAITVVYRSDSSGTTYNFTDYLVKSAAGIWQAGAGSAISWPAGITGIGSKGNEGVTAMVKRVKGSIGYVEFSYASKNHLAWTRLKTAQGFVVPKISFPITNDEQVNLVFRKSFEAVAKNAQWEKVSGMGVVLVNYAGEDGWPLVASTFIIMQRQQDNPVVAKEVLNFFHFAFTQGEKAVLSLSYVPMPEKVWKFIENSWSQTLMASGPKGKPVWP